MLWVEKWWRCTDTQQHCAHSLIPRYTTGLSPATQSCLRVCEFTKLYMNFCHGEQRSETWWADLCLFWQARKAGWKEYQEGKWKKWDLPSLSTAKFLTSPKKCVTAMAKLSGTTFKITCICTAKNWREGGATLSEHKHRNTYFGQAVLMRELIFSESFMKQLEM